MKPIFNLSLFRFVYLTIFAIVLFTTSSRSDAHEVIRFLNMNGANGATASGVITLDLDIVTMQVQLNFSGLTSNSLLSTTSFLHATTPSALSGTAPIASLNFFNPALLTDSEKANFANGIYNHTFDLTVAQSYDPQFITNSGGTVSLALNTLVAAVENERSYLSIRTAAFPSGDGELRGFLTAVPEPSGLLLLGISVSCIALGYRSKRKKY